jgi:beta-glucosidase-like glycosyl hydrolase
MENVNEGKVKMERIDEAVLRILTLKYDLGLKFSYHTCKGT